MNIVNVLSLYVKEYITDNEFENINDCFIENIISNNIDNDEIISLLKSKYSRKEKVIFECEKINSVKELHYEIREKFNFSKYYGMNWYALTDYLSGGIELPSDDGGHLIGSQFLGSGNIYNLVPMNSQINRAGGKWYNMETEWANALKEGKDVQAKIQNIYEPNNSRPVSLKIKYTIEGEKTKIIKILNKSGG